MNELIHVLAGEHDLIDEALRLSELRAQPYYTPDRKEQLDKLLNRVIFEIRCQQGDFDAVLT